MSNLSDGRPGQGIVHVIGPELGLTLPGMTIVCGDSHQHARCIRFARVRHRNERSRICDGNPNVAADQAASMAITVEGELQPGVLAKDIILAIIGKTGTGGASAR
ncbi:MAG: aconitase family protein [Thermomicrobiales bacterium]